MGCVENGSARCFIYTSGFHADQTVFNDIDRTDAVSAPQFIQFFQKGNRFHLFAVEADRNALFKIDFHVLYLIRRVFRLAGQYMDVFLMFIPRILQITALVTDMPDIFVSGIDLFYRLMD